MKLTYAQKKAIERAISGVQDDLNRAIKTKAMIPHWVSADAERIDDVIVRLQAELSELKVGID